MAPLPMEKGVPADLPCNCLLSSALRQLPFPFNRSISPQPSNTHQTAPVDLGHVHASLVSAAEQCIRALSAVASGNPLFKSLSSLPANFQNFCQIRYRNSTSPTSLSMHNFAAILPGDSVTGLVVANGISNFLNLYNTLLVVRLVLTWFPNSPPAIVSPLSTLCDPYLNIFRGIIPPLGGTLDLSPILAFLVLNAFTSSAAALPAELPVTGTPQQDLSSSNLMPLNLTCIRERWMKRICCKRVENSKDRRKS